jgi:hypothetical protein
MSARLLLQALAWSPTGERLAVVYAATVPEFNGCPWLAESSCEGASAVALFLTETENQSANIRTVFRGWVGAHLSKPMFPRAGCGWA